MKYVPAWILMAVAVAIGVGSLNWPTYRRMVMRGVSGQATVIELLPKNHNSLRYEYFVAGKPFRGQMQSWSPNPPLEQLAVGQSLAIYFDPNHPEVSVLGNPVAMLKNETICVGLAAILVPTCLMIAWVWWRSPRSWITMVADIL